MFSEDIIKGNITFYTFTKYSNLKILVKTVSKFDKSWKKMLNIEEFGDRFNLIFP